MSRPVCALPGCTNHVKWRGCRFCCPQHVPYSVRKANGLKSRAAYAYRERMKRFEREIKALQNRTITREELLAVFKAISNRAYQSGYCAGLRRQQRTEAAA